jgi:poly(hydroxyalkanoate) granule-associated protein
LLISVGALALAEEQASDLLDSFVKRGEKTRKAGKKYVKKLLKNGSKTSAKPVKKEKKAERQEDDWVQRALHWLNIPTRNDIEQINKKVEALARRVA